VKNKPDLRHRRAVFRFSPLQSDLESNLSSRRPVCKEHIRLVLLRPLPMRNPDHLFAVRVEHRQAVKAIAVGEAPEAGAAHVDGMEFEVSHPASEPMLVEKMIRLPSKKTMGQSSQHSDSSVPLAAAAGLHDPDFKRRRWDQVLLQQFLVIRNLLVGFWMVFRIHNPLPVGREKWTAVATHLPGS
jgi:hypothetical protein